MQEYLNLIKSVGEAESEKLGDMLNDFLSGKRSMLLSLES